VFSEDTPKYKEIEEMKQFLMNKKLNYCKL